MSVDICECAAGDCVGGSGGTCFTRDHLGNPRQPPQRVWSRISHRSTHILFSCGQTCSNADASTRGKANLILQSNSSSWMERFWPLCLNFVFFFFFQGPVFLGADLWRECVCLPWQVYQHAGQLHIASVYPTGMCQKGYWVNSFWISSYFFFT